MPATNYKMRNGISSLNFHCSPTQICQMSPYIFHTAEFYFMRNQRTGKNVPAKRKLEQIYRKHTARKEKIQQNLFWINPRVSQHFRRPACRSRNGSHIVNSTSRQKSNICKEHLSSFIRPFSRWEHMRGAFASEWAHILLYIFYFLFSLSLISPHQMRFSISSLCMFAILCWMSIIYCQGSEQDFVSVARESARSTL